MLTSHANQAGQIQNGLLQWMHGLTKKVFHFMLPLIKKKQCKFVTMLISFPVLPFTVNCCVGQNQQNWDAGADDELAL